MLLILIFNKYILYPSSNRFETSNFIYLFYFFVWTEQKDVCLSDIFSFNHSHQTIKTKWANPFTGSKNPLPESAEAEQNQYRKILDPPNKSLALWFRLRLGSSSRWSPLTCRSRGLPKRSFSNRSSSHQHLGN